MKVVRSSECFICPWRNNPFRFGGGEGISGSAASAIIEERDIKQSL